PAMGTPDGAGHRLSRAPQGRRSSHIGAAGAAVQPYRRRGGGPAISAAAGALQPQRAAAVRSLAPPAAVSPACGALTLGPRAARRDLLGGPRCGARSGGAGAARWDQSAPLAKRETARQGRAVSEGGEVLLCVDRTEDDAPET